MLKLALATLLAALALAAPAQAASRVIVGYRDGVTSGQRAQVRASVHGRLIRSLDSLNAEVDRVSSVRRLERDPRVRYVEPDRRLRLGRPKARTSDDYTPQEW